MSHVYTTPRGYRRLLERIEKARLEYKRVCDSNEEAAEGGDNSVWHDNFAYEENQRQMHQLSRKVRDLEVLSQQIQIIQPPQHVPSKVRLGVSIRLQSSEEAEPKVFFIAGYDDGDPKAHRLSYNSPLATALIGKEEGDSVPVQVGERTFEVEILEILPAPPDEIETP